MKDRNQLKMKYNLKLEMGQFVILPQALKRSGTDMHILLLSGFLSSYNFSKF